MTDQGKQNNTMLKIIALALTIIIGLISTIWAVTWNDTNSLARDNREDITDIKILIAQQQKQYDYLKERVDQIYQEVKDK